MKGKNVSPLQDTLVMLMLLAQSQDSLAKGEKTYSTAEVKRLAQAALRRFQGH
jgi:hypothetical protein